MLQIGSKINLRGLSQKGKNRIRELGFEWEIIKIAERVQFSSEPGPWLFIQSVRMRGHIRWIHQNRDKDFQIEHE